MVSLLAGVPFEAAIPQELTVISLRPSKARRKSPSAIGLRQVLPVQTKSTCFSWDIALQIACFHASRQTAMDILTVRFLLDYIA